MEECKDPIKLTRLEYEILKWAKEERGQKYIFRDANERLRFCNTECEKGKSYWKRKSNKNYTKGFGIHTFDELFQFVKWEDDEPTLIQDILNNCEFEEGEH